MSSMDDPQPRIIEILVDNREARSPVPEALKQIPGVVLQFNHLAVGYYVVDQRCVFERKTVVDFANSVADGRLFVQAHKLVSQPEPAAIILEGRASALAEAQMRRNALQAVMIA